MNHQGTAIKEKRQKATRLPNDWILPSEYLDWTLNTYAAATEADVFGTADRFKDYWIARAGATALKLDWFATWRNWIRNDYERRPQKKTSGPDFDDTSWADDLGAL
ncbi:hypothetical protein [Pseudomonas luteola]|nr:hypothetical protein [Pseudomonas zeshuii]